MPTRLRLPQIMARLDDRFRLLTGGSRRTLPRQKTLQATIDWSYDLLDEREQAVLRRLSGFAGGWSLEAAEAVCADESVAQVDIFDALASLVDKSLARSDPQEAAVRYLMLETVCQYAADRLKESGETEAVQSRAAAWFLALAEQAEPQLSGPEQAAWLGRLETEHNNLRASLTWYERREDTEAGLRLSGALWRFWVVRGHLSEGRQWLGRAMERTEGRQGATGWEASAVWAKSFHGAGTLAYRQGDYAPARALCEKSLVIHRRMGNQQGIAVSLHNLGNVAERQDDCVVARSLHKERLTIRRRLGDQEGIAASLEGMAGAAQGQN